MPASSAGVQGARGGRVRGPHSRHPVPSLPAAQHHPREQSCGVRHGGQRPRVATEIQTRVHYNSEFGFRSHRLHFGCPRAVCGDRLLSKTEDISITTEGPAPHSPQNEAESADGAPQVRTEDDFAFKAIPRSRVAGTARAPGREAGPPPGEPPRPLLRTFPPRSLPEPAGLTQQ